MKIANKVDTEVEDVIKLISKEDAESEFGEAVASQIAKDHVVTWAKFVLTDDKPNGNGQRIPAEEFDNLIRTGSYMPVKMALGSINDGHEDAKPIGVITNLTKLGNKIYALAALWDHERTDDVASIKEMVNSNKPVNISWEILYGRTFKSNGITDLLDTMLKAATIVGIPAYAGRTQLLAVAAKKWSPAYIQKLPDTSFLHVTSDGTRYFAYRDETGKIDPSRFQPITEEIANAPLPENTLKGLRHQVKKLSAMISADASLQEILGEGVDNLTEDFTLETKELEGKVSDLEAKLALANDNFVAKEKELVDALALAEQANTTVKTLEEELNPLRQFKLDAEAEAGKAAKLSGIKAKFEGLGLVKDEKYFTDNTEKLMAMDENSLDFMLQEMVAFKSESGTGEASLKLPKVPVLGGSTDDLSDLKQLAVALRERNKK
jgi:hypothetical protein